jgi:hypothetical protein
MVPVLLDPGLPPPADMGGLPPAWDGTDLVIAWTGPMTAGIKHWRYLIPGSDGPHPNGGIAPHGAGLWETWDVELGFEQTDDSYVSLYLAWYSTADPAGAKGWEGRMSLSQPPSEGYSEFGEHPWEFRTWAELGIPAPAGEPSIPGGWILFAQLAGTEGSISPGEIRIRDVRWAYGEGTEL